VALFDRGAAVIVLGEKWRAFVSSISSNPRVVCIFNPVVLSTGVEVSLDRRTSGDVLFLGELGSRKGVGDLIRAVASIRDRMPFVRLILCGNGDSEPFARQATTCGIGSHVSFPGWVVGAEKAKLMAASAVLALPSYHEGLPMAILEAMGCGLPVVASKVGSIPEAVTDGVEGLLVEPGDVPSLAAALERLLTDDGLRERVAGAARIKVLEKFDARIIVEHVSELYKEIGLCGVAPRGPAGLGGV
jgi:glycosyltransferase involved in cell wall biosynthesis